MSLTVALHRLEFASVRVFEGGGEQHGSVTIISANGDTLELYTTPEKARAIADAVNGKDTTK